MENKNVWLMPTDKLTKLYFSNYGKVLNLASNPKRKYVSGIHIYITSEESLKSGDWVKNITIDSEPPFKLDSEGVCYTILAPCKFKKIVLTTDRDVTYDSIAVVENGAQNLSEQFLQWFVGKTNDSGKPIDIVQLYKTPLMSNNGGVLYGYRYEAIIPDDKPAYKKGDAVLFTGQMLDTNYLDKSCVVVDDLNSMCEIKDEFGHIYKVWKSQIKRDFNAVYDKIVEESRFCLSAEEYKELIRLEYAIGQGYIHDQTSVDRYMFLSEKRNPPYFKK